MQKIIAFEIKLIPEGNMFVEYKFTVLLLDRQMDGKDGKINISLYPTKGNCEMKSQAGKQEIYWMGQKIHLSIKGSVFPFTEQKGKVFTTYQLLKASLLYVPQRITMWHTVHFKMTVFTFKRHANSYRLTRKFLQRTRFPDTRLLLIWEKLQ